MFVVAGVTGKTGQVAAQSLLARKQPVRVIVRKPEQGEAWRRKGAEVAVADIGDAGALIAAFRGAKGAYVLLPPNMGAQDFLAEKRAQADAIAEAVSRSGLPHVVFLSSLGAEQPSGTGPVRGLHYAEHKLWGTGRAVTSVRAGYFLENWGAVLPLAKAQGVLPTFFVPTAPIYSIATPDIGVVAADALIDGPRGRRIIDLIGPAEYTSNDIGQAVSSILGKPVAVQAAPIEALVPTFTSMGISQNVAELYRELVEGLRAGRVAPQGGANELRRGKLGPNEVFRPMLA